MRKPAILFGITAFAFAALGCAASGGPEAGPGGASKGTPAGKFEDALQGEVRYVTHVAVAEDGTTFLTDVDANRVYGYRDGARVIEISGLDRPLGLAVRGGRLYVGNEGRRNVEVYDLSARKGLFVIEGVTKPNGVAVAPDGTIYVADSKADVVRVFTAQGEAAGTLDGLKFPVAVAVDDARVIVGDQGNHRLAEFDRKGAFVRAIGEAVSEKASSISDYSGRFTRIQDVAMKGDRIYVLDSYHAHVQILDAEGKSLGFVGRAGRCSDCMALGLGIAVDGADNVLVADPENFRWVTLATVAR